MKNIHEKLGKGTEDRIAKIAARDKARRATGGKAPKPAPSLQGTNTGQPDGAESAGTEKLIKKVTKGVKPASKKAAAGAAEAHGDVKKENSSSAFISRLNELDTKALKMDPAKLQKRGKLQRGLGVGRAVGGALGAVGGATMAAGGLAARGVGKGTELAGTALQAAGAGRLGGAIAGAGRGIDAVGKGSMSGGAKLAKFGGGQAQKGVAQGKQGHRMAQAGEKLAGRAQMTADRKKAAMDQAKATIAKQRTQKRPSGQPSSLLDPKTGKPFALA